MLEIRQPAWVAGFHQVGENVGVEKNNIERITDQSVLCASAVDVFNEFAYVLAWRHDAGEGPRFEWFGAAFTGQLLNRLTWDGTRSISSGSGAFSNPTAGVKQFCLQVDLYDDPSIWPRKPEKHGPLSE